MEEQKIAAGSSPVDDCDIHFAPVRNETMVETITFVGIRSGIIRNQVGFWPETVGSWCDSAKAALFLSQSP